jgi:hypothetical protein
MNQEVPDHTTSVSDFFNMRTAGPGGITVRGYRKAQFKEAWQLIGRATLPGGGDCQSLFYELLVSFSGHVDKPFQL